MTLRSAILVGIGVTLVGTLWAYQAPFREFPGVEYQLGTIPLPPDYRDKTEFTFARLMYPSTLGGRGGGFGGGGFGFGGGYRGRERGPWYEGNSIWTQDYPRADRHFSQAMARLTRVSVRSVEQPINLDQGTEFDWPWLYAVQAGRMQLTDSQARGLREYLLRGGFFMADDFWGENDWETFMTRHAQSIS